MSINIINAIMLNESGIQSDILQNICITIRLVLTITHYKNRQIAKHKSFSY